MRGHELQRTRAKLNKNQAEMAAALGVATRTISRWESGDLPIPQDAVERLQSLHLDDNRSLIRVSSRRLLQELMDRADIWDSHGLTSAMPPGPRLRAVASDMKDCEGGDDQKAP